MAPGALMRLATAARRSGQKDKKMETWRLEPNANINGISLFKIGNRVLTPTSPVERGNQYYVTWDPEGPSEQTVNPSPVEDDAIIEFGTGKKGGFIGRRGKKIVLRRGGAKVENRGAYLCRDFEDKSNFFTCTVVAKVTLESVADSGSEEFSFWKKMASEKRLSSRVSVLHNGKFADFVPGGAMSDQFNVWSL